MEAFDLVIVGAGLHGLVVCKTYLEVHPDASVAFFDNASTIGGVWCKDRLYPGLKTNNLWSRFEFSDYPMTGFGLDENDHVPGTVVHEYLNAFAKDHDLTRRIRLNTHVENAEYQGSGGWVLQILDSEQGQSKIHTRKLVVATGLNSEPAMPELPGMDEFGKPLFHTKEWAARAKDAEGARTVAVLGGSKSAMDVANSSAARGAQVHWIIRKSGFGPGWTSPTRVTPLKIRLDKLITARILTFFSPCIWAVDGYPKVRDFLHRSWLGRKIVARFYADNQKDIFSIIGYDKHPETAKLKPWTDVFWHGADVSVLNYKEDLMAQVRSGRIQVHIADIDHLTPGTIHLSDGSQLSADVLLCATGWKFKPPLHFSGISAEELGLPLAETPNPELVQMVDTEIFKRFPMLAKQPVGNPHSVPLPAIGVAPKEPYRLYRFTVPPKLVPTRNVAFAGALHNVTTCLVAQAQALWITAYFDDKLNNVHLPSQEMERSEVLTKLEYETYLHTQFSKRRTPLAFGSRHPDFSTDSLAFIDLLLKDLGLRIWRKSSIRRELFDAYTMKDYGGLVTEWLGKLRLSEADQKEQVRATIDT